MGFYPFFVLDKGQFFWYNNIYYFNIFIGVFMANLLIAHGGAPTAVLNASLVGAIEEARKFGFNGKILASKYGSKGLLNEEFIDLSKITEESLNLLKTTPGSAIGTSRYPLYEEEYLKIVDILKKHQIKYILFSGGNGTMDTIGNIHKYALEANYAVYCGGIPKTIDNDIAVTDHAPGFASNAQYMAHTVNDCAQDIKGLPIHVSIIETMGRNTGWLAASSALAKRKVTDAPHLIYVPERTFYPERFLNDVNKLYHQYGGVIVVASEGLKGIDGKPIVPPTLTTSRAMYYGDVSVHLASLVLKELGIKSRSEKPGIIGRCSSHLVSTVDRLEAIEMGALAANAVLSHKNGYMAGLKRISTNPYVTEKILIPISEVMMTEKTLPDEFINEEGNGVTEKFIEWAKPLIDPIPNHISFLDNEE